MEIIVKSKFNVQEEEFIIKQFNNVFVKVMNFGMVLLVWFNLNVVVVKYGTKLLSNVIAHQTLIGMEQIVYFVLMERYGIKPEINVFVEKELNGMDNFVL